MTLEEILAKANEALEKEAYDSALEWTSRALEIDFHSIGAWMIRGKAQQGLEENSKAIESFERVLGIDPEHAVAWFYKGVSCNNLEKFEEAIPCYTRATDLYPEFSVAWLNKGYAHNMLKDYDNVIFCYGKATELDPGFTEAWFNQGNAYYNLRKDEEAILCFKRATDLDSGFTNAWFNKGNAYYRLGEDKEAIRCYKGATDLDPKFTHAWFYKGSAYDNLKENEKAIYRYNRATDLDPGLTDAWFRKGNAYYNLENYDKAISAYNSATDLDPGLTMAWYKKGKAYQRLKKNEEAFTSFIRATHLDPRFTQAWFEKGNACDNLHEYTEALSCFDKATNLDPGFKEAWVNKGNAYRHLKMYGEAMSCYNRATDLDPNFPDTMVNIGHIYADLKEYHEALYYYGMATHLDPAFTLAWFNKGIAYAILENYEEAVTCFGRATDLDPEDPASWYFKGMALLGLNRSQESANSFRRAYMEDPIGFNLLELVHKYKEHLSDPFFVRRIFKDFPALRLFPGLNDYAKEIHAEVADMALFVEAIDSGKFLLEEKEALMIKGKIFYYYGDAEMALQCFDQLDDLDDQDLAVKYYYIISLQALAKTEEATLMLKYVTGHYKEWIEESGNKTDQKYYAAIILSLLENFPEALQLINEPEENSLPLLYLKYWFEGKLFLKEASTTLFSILRQEEKMLVQDYRGFLFPHAIGEIFVDETTKVISPVQYHAVSQEIWEPIQMVLKVAVEVAAKPENDLPAVNARLKLSGDYYRTVPFMGSLKFKEDFQVNLNRFLKARREEDIFERAKNHLRQVSKLKWRNYSLIDQQMVSQDECERAFAERLEIMGSGYIEEYADINQILIYFLLMKKLNPEAFFLLAAFTAYLTNREKEMQKEKDMLDGIKKIVFLTKVASTVNAYSIGIVFTLSALIDVSVNEMYNYGPDILDAYLENLGSERLSYVDFKMRYSEFLSNEYSRLGTEEFEKVYNLKNIFGQSSNK